MKTMYNRNLIMETIDYGDLIQRPVLCIYVYRPYQEALYKDVYINIKVFAKQN